MDKHITKKVVAYITYQDSLLVFRHTDFPEAGIQVPAGTVDAGESVEAAVFREAWEESGLEDLEICNYLGMDELEFELFWVKFPDEVPELSGGQDAMLARLVLPDRSADS